MRKTKSGMLYSPTDLIRFMESPFVSWMDRLRLEAPDKYKPDEESEEKKLIAKTGDLHEGRYLKHLQESGADVCVLEKGETEEALKKTMSAIKEGREVIYQPHLCLEPFRGFADFLVRDKDVKEPPFQYEIWDAKLARKAKPYYLIQLCCYAEMMKGLTGLMPQKVRVILGSDEIVEFRTADFFHYYLNLKNAFLSMMDAFDPSLDPPEPDPRADHGVWQSYADSFLDEKDHLVRVAGISVGQIKKLHKEGISRMAELAALEKKSIPKLNLDILDRLIEQAALQIETKKIQLSSKPNEVVIPRFRVLPADEIDPRFGLSSLPPASVGDVYFDIEGFPLVDGGLEYLFGASYQEKNGELKFRDWWAHDSKQERKAFEDFVDWAFERWKADPKMHIYHYAAYEVSAARRLMGRYGTREERVDELLRNKVFVDLYKIVHQGLRVGVPSYSIKHIEHLYRPRRVGDVKAAGESIVYYANWIESGESSDWQKSKILAKIRDYNKDDCDSLYLLAGWLREQQKQSGIVYIDKHSSEEKEKAPRNEQAEQKLKLKAELSAKLALPEGSPSTGAERDRMQIQEVLGQLLDFHRRENKPIWWRMFDRQKMTAEELKDDINCLGACVPTKDAPVPVKKSYFYSFEFDPNQDCKIKEGDKLRPSHNLDVGLEVEFFDSEGRITVKISKAMLEKLGGKFPPVVSFIPDEFVNPDPMPQSLMAIATKWSEGQQIKECLRRLLLRLPPAIKGHMPDQSLIKPGEEVGAAAVRIVASMSDSVFCIQGPPGSGKTTTASAMIAHLLGGSKNVGITSNSHKAISHLIKACNSQMGGRLTGIKADKNAEDEVFMKCPGLTRCETSGEAAEKYSGGLIAGTAWLFARDDMENRLDYLFVDEAGQVSLANLVAMSRAAKNIVMMGDQMQLEQPVQGSHPGESGLSALNYYLKGHPTIPSNLGLFLGTSYRMHPSLCEFVSEMIYEGRLKPAAENRNLALRIGGAPNALAKEAGIMFYPVVHDGNTQASEEEVKSIVAITGELLKCEFTSKDGKVRRLTSDDILYVAPYNMQVRQIKAALPNAKVGSVDKFQGQEAVVVIVSLCTSAGEESPRGMEFLLDKNRINVAVSRAQALAIVVGDPRIASSSCSDIANMRRLNLFCCLTVVGSSDKTVTGSAAE
jgi:predicted RecB family nuclease